MRKLALSLLAVAAVAYAGGNGVGSGGLNGFQPVNPGSFTPSNSPNLYQCTTAAMTLYVDPTGSDSNDCTATGTSACLTIQGAINKVPRCLRHGVVINVAAGTYAGFYVSGFLCDPSVQTTTGGLFIDALAAFADAGVATGTATGTASSSSAGSGTTFGTLTDSTQTWTSNDLVGRFITAAGQTRVISSNTGTVVTIVGTWTSPGAVAYSILDPGVIVSTATSAPATGLQAASANSASLIFASNNCGARTQSITVRGVRISNATGVGINASDVSAGFITLSQVRNTSTAGVPNIGIGQTGTSSLTSASGRWDLTDVDILVPQNGVGVQLLNGASFITRAGIRTAATSTTGISLSPPATTSSISSSDLNGPVTPVNIGGRLSAFSGSHVTCATGAGTGIVVGVSPAFSTFQSATANAQVSGALVTTCGIGLAANGATSSADLTGLTGTAATTGIQAQGGAAVTYTSGSTITGTTQDISIDNGAVTAALADVAAATCISSGAFGSKVCQR